MEVTFQITLADYQAFERAVKAQPLRGLGPFFVGATSFAIATAFFAANLQVPVALRLWVLGGTLLLSGIVAMVALQGHRGRIEKLPLLQEPISVATNEEGVSGVSNRGRETVFWPTLHRILETETHFFVLTAPKAGLIIPKRAFDSPAQCAAFGDFLKQQWARHHPNAAPIAAPR